MGRLSMLIIKKSLDQRRISRSLGEVFQNELGAWVDKSDFSWRETTFSRKIDWVKNHQQEELQQLVSSRKPSRRRNKDFE